MRLSARTGSGGEGEECRGVDAFWPSHRVAAKGPGKPLGSTRIDPPMLNQVHCPQRCFEGCGCTHNFPCARVPFCSRVWPCA